MIKVIAAAFVAAAVFPLLIILLVTASPAPLAREGSQPRPACPVPPRQWPGPASRRTT